MRSSTARFPTTQWNCVTKAGDRESHGAEAAMAAFCQCYWYPIYTFIRVRGYSVEATADLTQEYFLRLMEGRLLSVADSRKGRFRSLLRTDLEFFLADEHDRRTASKRGGSRIPFSLNVSDAESRYKLEPSTGLDPVLIFDRAWVLDILARALERLGLEEARSGRGRAFGLLKSVLTEGQSSVPYIQLARELDTTVPAIQSSIQRLRGRYRQALRIEVAATLDNPSTSEVDDEIRSLFQVLDR